MACCAISFLFLILAIFVTIVYKVYCKICRWLRTPAIPKLEETWWGSRPESEEDDSIKPFKISVKDEVLNDLKKRLDRARPFTPPLEGIQQQYGMNTKLLSEIVNFWKTKYNWREREQFLNKYPQFTVSVQGLRLHYLHIKPQNTEGLQVLPLLLLHGWPGSVREFYEIIPLLTTPRSSRSFVFEVIAPSLPGYGFSEGTVRPGLGAVQMTVVFKNFMKKLGFDKYYIQGGDWGAIIVQHMATLYPDRILGAHSNMCFVNSLSSNLKLFLYSFWPSLIVKKEHQNKMYPLSKKFTDTVLETGYMHLQATKPDTVGVALNDSPVGLAAYILEKFTTWTNSDWKNRDDGGLTQKYSYTALLDNVMIYWVTSSITTSMRLYSETFNKAQNSLGIAKIPITVPIACARFSHELAYLPKEILKEKYENIVHESDLEGGHFAAFEVPEVMADDIFEGFGEILQINKNKS